MSIPAENLAGMSYEASDAQELLDVLKMMSPRTRSNSSVQLVVGDDLYEIWEVGFAQSDQAEKTHLKVYIKAHPLAR